MSDNTQANALSVKTPRRRFLKNLGKGALAVALAGTNIGAAQASSEPV